ASHQIRHSNFAAVFRWLGEFAVVSGPVVADARPCIEPRILQGDQYAFSRPATSAFNRESVHSHVLSVSFSASRTASIRCANVRLLSSPVTMKSIEQPIACDSFRRVVA